jgi:glycosyltransferase involved in cell wall biosynthesis
MFAHNFEAAVPVWLASKVRRVPYFYHIHDNLTLSHQFPRPLKAILDRIDERFIGDASAVLVPDECRILPYAEKYRDHILVLPNVFRRRPDCAPARVAASERFTVLALGSLRLDRGVGMLLEATRTLPGVRVLLAGHVFDREIGLTIRSHAAVEYRGLLSSAGALELYSESDVVFMFYDPRVELNVRAAPIKLGESLMMGLPVLINSEAMISSRIVETWRVGYRCPYDSTALAELLVTVRDDAAGRIAMSDHARKVYGAHFRWECYEPRFLEVVRGVLSRVGCGPATMTCSVGASDKRLNPHVASAWCRPAGGSREESFERSASDSGPPLT